MGDDYTLGKAAMRQTAKIYIRKFRFHADLEITDRQAAGPASVLASFEISR